MVFYCECAVGFCGEIGYQDGKYYDALAHMFEAALKAIAKIPASDRKELIGRLDEVCNASQDFGYGVGVEMESSFAKYVKEC